MLTGADSEIAAWKRPLAGVEDSKATEVGLDPIRNTCSTPLTNALTARTLTRNGHVLRVTTETGDVRLNPFQSLYLIS